MRLKPVFDTSYLVRYERDKDSQTSEVVDTTDAEIITLISQTFKGKFLHPTTNRRELPYTRVKVIQLDNNRKQSRLCKFSYTRNGKDFERPFVKIYNLSPREVRLRLEKAIRDL